MLKVPFQNNVYYIIDTLNVFITLMLQLVKMELILTTLYSAR